MKLKNICNKPISVGGVCILPGETKGVSESFATNPVIETMQSIGYLEVVVKKKAQEPPEDTGSKDDDPPAGGSDDDPPAGGSDDDPPAGSDETGKKPLSRMNKGELQEECRRLGIEFSPDDTNPVLAEKIKAATAG